MEELIAQTQRELIDLPAAWKQLGSVSVVNSARCYFPVVWYGVTNWSFFKLQKHFNHAGFTRLWKLDESDDVKVWRPRRDLNPCYRRERAMS